MRLPSELRLQIFECMLEDLDQAMLFYKSNERRDWVSLMQVNYEFCSEISTILFRSPGRQVDAAVHVGGFDIFEVPYSLDPHSSGPPKDRNHACMASQHCPERIMHLYLHIYVESMCESDDKLFKGLVNLWYLAKAVSP